MSGAGPGPGRRQPLKASYDCLPCAVGSLITLFNKGLVPQDKREPAMRALLAFLSRIDYAQTPARMGRQMHRLIRDVLDDPDPYREIKRGFNDLMLRSYPGLKAMVDGAADPLMAALKLAIAGNIIDFGPNRPFDLEATFERARTIDLAIDDSPSLREDLRRAGTLLYLGDNAGEIVTDRILLETIRHPNVSFAVRGGPVLNDATIDDAEAAGIDKIAQVISSGDDTPGIDLDSCSAGFRDIFDRADLIIAKGQGNFEGLCGTDKNIYFVLMAKCDLIASHLGVRKGDFVVAAAA